MKHAVIAIFFALTLNAVTSGSVRSEGPVVGSLNFPMLA